MVSGETIAAIATAPGCGGVAVVRVSGPAALDVARKVAKRPPQVGRVVMTAFVDPLTGAKVDEGLVLAFKAPRSYTGEDVAEFQGHGGAVAPRRLLDAAIAAGARLARRGEFTERAFLNGKLDYDQAESVLDLINAKTERAADAALEGLAGRRQRQCRDFYDRTVEISAKLEHALDIDEGELPCAFCADRAREVDRLRQRLEAALCQAHEGKILREGVRVVLAGRPNVGKSSLMNALLKENRAIVSDTPGTTRDSIEEWLDLDGWPVRLVDTAGLRATDDAIEAEGVRRSEALIANADIVLALSGADEPRERFAATSAQILRVTTKCDLQRGEGLNVSVKTGEGLEDLKSALVVAVKACAAKPIETPDLPVLESMKRAIALLPATCDDLVLAGNALRQAAETLGEAIGATYTADLLNNLFSRFCVGK